MHSKEIEISIALIKHNSSYICLERNQSPFKNAIEFPGGKRLKNESIHQCLSREIREELNINIIKYKYVGYIKHLYDDKLVKINIFKIFEYQGDLVSKEKRNIILYKNNVDYYLLPTHQRILNILKVPRMLKIITMENFSVSEGVDFSIYRNIRLKDIPYDFYKKHMKNQLMSHGFNGKIIIDYPYYDSWRDNFDGIHFNSTLIDRHTNNIKDPAYIFSASCHLEKDIKLCNEKYFDFILLSPILHSHNSYPSIGWSKFEKLSRKSYCPVLALGGLSTHDGSLIKCTKYNGFGIAGISKF